MSKNKPASLTQMPGFFPAKGNAAPTTPVVAQAAPAAEEGGAPTAVTVASAEPAVEAPAPAVEPAPVEPKPAAKTSRGPAPAKPKSPATRPTPKELGGALISTTVKLDQARYKEVKMAGVLSGKTFQDIAVEAIDLWLAANADQG
jgi:hypothetical protein